MKSRLPPPTPDYVGYEEERKKALEEIESLPVLLVTGMPGAGKTEFVLKVSERFLSKSSLKPILIELRQPSTLKELYLELAKTPAAQPASDVRDAMGDLLAELDSKKKWIVIENTHELD